MTETIEREIDTVRSDLPPVSPHAPGPQPDDRGRGRNVNFDGEAVNEVRRGGVEDLAVDVKKLRVVTVIAPLAFLVAFELFSVFVLIPLMGSSSVLRILLIFAILTLAVVPFSFWVFGTIERQQHRLEESSRVLESVNEEVLRRNQQLEAVNTAIVSISSALDLAQVLQNITDAARDLLRSRYAALGVADETGRIVQFITAGITPEQGAAIGTPPQGHGLLGALIKEGQPLRIPNIQEDLRSHGFPPNHPPMTSLLGVPILFKGKPVGDLYLADKVDGKESTAEDQELLVLLANHAAVAIENARLYEEVRTARDRLQIWNEALEAKVAERTREIERYSKELTTRVLRAQEEERKRIARELHDETAQSLSTLLINLDLLEPQVTPDNQLLHSGFERVRMLARRTLDETRALSHDLRPTILDDVGLEAALHWFADEYTRTFGIPVQVKTDCASVVRLSADQELALFRIAQEALTNSGKYAEASEAVVTLTCRNGSAMLVIEDDGKGFDLAAVQRPTRQGGLGLYGMQERADLLGGTLTIDSAPDKGTRVTVVAPLNNTAGSSGLQSD